MKNFLEKFFIWNANLSATVITHYDGTNRELRAYGFDFGRAAIILTIERKGTRNG